MRSSFYWELKCFIKDLRGGYKAVAVLFNVPDDHRRLLSFLRKHNCHLPEHDLRQATADLDQGRARRAIGQ